MRHAYGDIDVDTAPDDPADRTAYVHLYSESDDGVTHAFELREGGQDAPDRLRTLARALTDAAHALEVGEQP